MIETPIDDTSIAGRMLETILSTYEHTGDVVFLTIAGEEFEFEPYIWRVGGGVGRAPTYYSGGPNGGQAEVEEYDGLLRLSGDTWDRLETKFGDRAIDHAEIGAICFVFKAGFQDENHPDGPRYVDVWFDTDHAENGGLYDEIEDVRLVKGDES